MTWTTAEVEDGGWGVIAIFVEAWGGVEAVEEDISVSIAVERKLSTAKSVWQQCNALFQEDGVVSLHVWRVGRVGVKFHVILSQPGGLGLIFDLSVILVLFIIIRMAYHDYWCQFDLFFKISGDGSG